MKKKLSIVLILVALIAVAGGAYWYLHQVPVIDPTKNLGVAQTVDNQQGKATFTVSQAGYYDVANVSGEATALPVSVPSVSGNILSGNSGIPGPGQVFVGQYFSKDEKIDLSANGKIAFEPAKFPKLSEPISLKETGNYLVGVQFPAGTYELTLSGELSALKDVKPGADATPYIVVDAFLPVKDGGQYSEPIKLNGAFYVNYELTDKSPSIKMNLKSGEFLFVNLSGQSGASVNLKRE